MEKKCEFKGEKHFFISEQELIYLSSEILYEAISKYNGAGGQIALVLKAATQLMK